MMNSNSAKKYSLRIFDDDYTILSDEAEAHVVQLAQQVDNIMNDIARKSGGMDPKRIAVLAALKIASSLFALESEFKGYEKHHQRLVDLIEQQIANSS